MNKVLFIKYGELCLKGNNKNQFKKILIANLHLALSDYKCRIKTFYDYILVEDFNEEITNNLVDIIKFIPGFSFFSIAYKVEKNLNIINKKIITILPKNFFSFKVECKRQDKGFHLSSDEIKRSIGSYVLSNLECSVDVHNPQIKIYVEIKDEYAIFFIDKYKCTNGLPIGSSGKVLVLLSGGIDSPIASRLIMNRGFNVDFITFITPPHTSDKVIDKVRTLVNKITLNNLLQKETRLYICNYTPIQNELTHISRENYRITLLRRSFFRIASLLANKYNYDAIVTGEALGQVASQTIDSMNCISQATNHLIIRPLIAFEKEKIIALSKEIGTYETSILPYDDSCSLFAPKTPVTKPKIEVCLELESQIDLLFDLEKNEISKINVEIFKK